MATVTRRVAARPRDYVRVAGPDAEDFLQRMLSNDVTEAPCRAMLLTPKARLIAPLVVVRRADDDFLLLTEPGLGETVGATLLRATVRGQGRDRAGRAHVGRRLRRGRRHPERGARRARLRAARRRRRADALGRRGRARPDRVRDTGLGQGARRHDPSGRGGPRRDARLVHERLLSGPGADRPPAPPREGQPHPAGARGRRRRARATRSATATRSSAESRVRSRTGR